MSDSMTPNGALVIDANGRVSYDFQGHVHAQGLDLDAGTTGSPPNENRLRWISGSPVAEIFAFSLGSVEELELTTGVAALTLHWDSSDASGYAQLQTGAWVKLLLDSAGNSSFPLVPDGHQYALIWDGTNLNLYVDGAFAKAL